MVFHIPGIPGQPIARDNVTCAYTQKLVKFADMMMPRGHEIYFYGNEGCDVECTEFYDSYGDPSYMGFDAKDWIPYNEKAIVDIKKKFRKGDFLLIIGGAAQAPIVHAINEPNRSVEFGIGYTGVFLEFKVFESCAWMHTVYGERLGAYEGNGSWYDTVIPNYFDKTQFKDYGGNGQYFLYVGRLIQRKGVDVAIQVCEKLEVPLILAGEGDEINITYGEHVGKVGIEKRKELMGNAIALFSPSLYIEPFGGVHAEALLSGTPVISTDWGVYTETIENGINGYRCKTFGDFLYATQNCDKLDRQAIQKAAVDKYSLEAVAPKYEAYFNQLIDLEQGKGWYTEESHNFGTNTN
jgi:glycosyltransferase involved in cell wall biosynthesis